MSSPQHYDDITQIPGYDDMPDSERMFLWIEQRARKTFMHWKVQARGQQIVRADSYESHLVWATLEWVEQQKNIACQPNQQGNTPP